MMQKFIILLVSLLFSFGANAQLEINLSTASAPTPGGTVDVNVSVSNFDNIAITQYSLQWDSLVVSFDSLLNVTDELAQFSAGNIGTPETTASGLDGVINVSWSHSTTNGFSIPDNTTMYTIRLNVVGSDCDSTAFELGNVIEVLDGNLDNVTVDFTPLPIAIPGTDCESGGGGGGGGNELLTLSGSNLSGDAGSNVCMAVTVENFTDVLAAQGGMSWDPSVLSYTGVQNFGFSDFGDAFTEDNTDTGLLSFLWFDDTTVNPVSLADGTTLFEVCFDLIGDAGSSSTVSFIDSPTLEFSDGDSNPIPFTTNSSIISVNSGGGGGGGNDLLTLSGSNLSGNAGSNICMSITVENFADVLSAQGGMMWDPSVLSYTGVQNFGFAGFENAFTENNTDSGMLSFLWFDDTTVNPVTLADGSTLFDICFDIIGAGGSSSTVNFVDNPSIEFSDSNTNPIPFTTTTNTISVSGGGGGGGGSADLTISIENAMGDTGSNVCIPVVVDGLTDIQSLQGGITWDDSQLTYTGIQNVNDDLSSLATGENGDVLSFVWFDDSGVNPVTLPDGSTIFEICFDIIGGDGTTQISFAENPPLEFSDPDANVVEFDANPGILTIGEVVTGTFSLGCANSTLQGGENGCIDITTVNFTNIAAVQLSITWDASQLTYTGAENFNGAIGTVQFNQTGTNEVGLTWDSSNGQGVTVSDGTTMFSLCFDAVSCNGADLTGSLEFISGSQVPIEIGDGNANTVPFSFQPCNYIVDCDGEPPTCGVNFGVANISPPTCFGGTNGGISINPSVTGAGCSIVSCTWFQGTPGGQVIPSTDCNLTGVPPGDYFLVVTTTDGVSQQTFQEDYTIPNTPPFTITSQIFNVSCNSLGSVTATITGGSGSYLCEWQHNGAIGCSIGGLESGTYTLLITDSILGCSQVEEFSVGIDFNLIATATPTGADCGGGTISVTLNQAGSFNYAWSHGGPNSAVQTGLDPGTYNVTVTDEDGNCTATTSAVVDFEATPVMIEPLPIATTGTTCNGNDGTASFNIVGGCLPYDCSITAPDGSIIPCSGQNLIESLAAGEYDVLITDGSTSPGISASFIIEEFETIIATFSATNVSMTGPGQILINDISGGVEPYTCTWTTTDGGGLIQGDCNQTMLEVGTYFLTITDANGCTFETGGIPVTDLDPGPPDVGDQFITDVGCGNDCNGAWTASITGAGPFIYALTNSDGEVIESSELPISDLCKGEYDLVVTDVLGQQTTITITIGGPEALTSTEDVGSGDCDDGSGNGSIFIIASGGVGGYTYLWSNGDTTANPENLSAGIYQVVVTDDNDCSIEMIFEVEECPDTGGPESCGSSSTVLTPNRDGVNETLNVICASDYPNTFGVYDRFGRVIFETTNYDGQWDGTDMNGDIVTEGVYYWVMDSTFDNGDHRIFKGYVNVIRETR